MGRDLEKQKLEEIKSLKKALKKANKDLKVIREYKKLEKKDEVVEGERSEKVVNGT